ncbi:hypothetical protein VNO78_11346 [Psophocarpus tetragonolobus]|uniref:Uncharacterized protein n=1 Tax=Psophocarpus tetragonolobus TaxID=3891 RepID=A0AAN9SP25_PSOTE
MIWSARLWLHGEVTMTEGQTTKDKTREKHSRGNACKYPLAHTTDPCRRALSHCPSTTKPFSQLPTFNSNSLTQFSRARK